MPKITPYLWFDNQAEEAMTLYTSIFPNSRFGEVSRYGEGGPGEPGTIMSGTFSLDGQEFMVLNGGPQFKFNEAISLFVHCDTQEEVDRYWDQLVAGGEPGPCGWLKDKFGLSWQIIPKLLGELIGDSDPAKSQRVVQAMLQMSKIDSVALQAAYDQA
jgi:predicted 3-demethylubiquinone-9 3-methyltransferase (glyoxalase superfamily)